MYKCLNWTSYIYVKHKDEILSVDITVWGLIIRTKKGVEKYIFILQLFLIKVF